MPAAQSDSEHEQWKVAEWRITRDWGGEVVERNMWNERVSVSWSWMDANNQVLTTRYLSAAQCTRKNLYPPRAILRTEKQHVAGSRTAEDGFWPVPGTRQGQATLASVAATGANFDKKYI